MSDAYIRHLCLAGETRALEEDIRLNAPNCRETRDELVRLRREQLALRPVVAKLEAEAAAWGGEP
jgi:hypothetical protein